MQVLSLGMPRTGTLSMRVVLEKLGYTKTHHGYDIPANPDVAAAWGKLVDAKWPADGVEGRVAREMFDEVLGDYRALTNAPPVYFAEDLIAAYPEVRAGLNRAECLFPNGKLARMTPTLGRERRAPHPLSNLWPAH